MRFFHHRYAILLAFFLPGCGTFFPGARRQVDVINYSFSYDGSKVFYLEDRYAYKLISEKSRDRMYVCEYDVKRRKHRKIGRSAIMEVSPSGPFVYLGGDWKKKESPDLVRYDYSDLSKKQFSVKELPEDKKYMYIKSIEWETDKDIIAEVGITDKNPCGWRRKDEVETITRTKVAVSGSDADILENGIDIPEVKPRCLVSNDGRYILREEPAEKFFMFHTSLYIDDRKTGKRIYITRDSHLLSFFEGAGYILKYLGFGMLHAVGIK